MIEASRKLLVRMRLNSQRLRNTEYLEQIESGGSRAVGEKSVGSDVQIRSQVSRNGCVHSSTALYTAGHRRRRPPHL